MMSDARGTLSLRIVWRNGERLIAATTTVQAAPTPAATHLKALDRRRPTALRTRSLNPASGKNSVSRVSSTPRSVSFSNFSRQPGQDLTCAARTLSSSTEVSRSRCFCISFSISWCLIDMLYGRQG